MTTSPETTRLAKSYLRLRQLLGILGLILPFALILGLWLIFKVDQPGSISEYYYTGMGDVFVGIMCAVGLFLIAYPGYDWWDEWSANVAGTGAIGVALFPTTEAGQVATFIGTIHGISTALFFVPVACISLFLFTKTDPKLGPMTRRKKMRNRVYIGSGIVIFVAIALMGGLGLLPDDLRASLEAYRPVFWLETVAVLGFGTSWLVKGEAILKDQVEGNQS